MSGSWERSRYDKASYQDILDVNNKRINLIMENPGVCDPCRVPEPGFLGATGVSVDPNRSAIDIESELFNIRNYDRGLGYKPYCPKLQLTGQSDGLICGGGVQKGAEASQPRLKHLQECSFGQIDSRSVFPSCSLRGTGWDRWDPLCADPQELSSIEFPGESNISYRNVIKDTFQSCFLTPWDQTAALPKGPDEIPCQAINGRACAAFIGDLQPDRFSNPYPSNYPKSRIASA